MDFQFQAIHQYLLQFQLIYALSKLLGDTCPSFPPKSTPMLRDYFFSLIVHLILQRINLIYSNCHLCCPYWEVQ